MLVLSRRFKRGRNFHGWRFNSLVGAKVFRMKFEAFAAEEEKAVYLHLNPRRRDRNVHRALRSYDCDYNFLLDKCQNVWRTLA